MQLPVLQDVPRCREWSARVGSQAGYQAPAPPLWTRRLDGIFLHPIGGPLVFLAVVVAVFQAMFTGARPLMDATDALVNGSGAWLSAQLPATWWRDLIIEGIWGGVGKVIVFLPQILLLFAFIGLLEDSGYLARAALIADRTMARAGLQGKSFIRHAVMIPALNKLVHVTTAPPHHDLQNAMQIFQVHRAHHLKSAPNRRAGSS